MKNKANVSEVHSKWHKRVEGQIKHCMNSHPEYFRYKTELEKQAIINSLSKRIVGEIVADCILATTNVNGEPTCLNANSPIVSR